MFDVHKCSIPQFHQSRPSPPPPQIVSLNVIPSRCLRFVSKPTRWKSIQIRNQTRNQIWKSMENHWKPMENHLKPMENHWKSWKKLKNLENQWKSMENDWKSMENPWKIIEHPLEILKNGSTGRLKSLPGRLKSRSWPFEITPCYPWIKRPFFTPWPFEITPFSMDFQWFSIDFTLIFKIFQDFQWFSIDFQWFSMGFQWFSMDFQMGFGFRVWLRIRINLWIVGLLTNLHTIRG